MQPVQDAAAVPALLIQLSSVGMLPLSLLIWAQSPLSPNRHKAPLPFSGEWHNYQVCVIVLQRVQFQDL